MPMNSNEPAEGGLSRRAAVASASVNCPTIRSKAALGYGGKLVFTTKRSPKGMTFSFAK